MSENNKVVYDRSSTKPFLRKGNLLVEVDSRYSLLKIPLTMVAGQHLKEKLLDQNC